MIQQSKSMAIHNTISTTRSNLLECSSLLILHFYHYHAYTNLDNHNQTNEHSARYYPVKFLKFYIDDTATNSLQLTLHFKSTMVAFSQVEHIATNESLKYESHSETHKLRFEII